MIKIYLIVMFLSFAAICRAQDTPIIPEDFAPVVAGTELLLGPIPFTGDGTDLMHDGWELDGFSFAVCTVWDGILRSFFGVPAVDCDIAVPLMVATVTTGYRIGEMTSKQQADLAWRHEGMDLVGDVAWITFKLRL
jgi:hypothetical protein